MIIWAEQCLLGGQTENWADFPLLVWTYYVFPDSKVLLAYWNKLDGKKTGRKRGKWKWDTIMKGSLYYLDHQICIFNG